MTNTKTTKRALFASVLSLLLCISMLIGSTFAWFTDTATTGVNTIQAGTLDVGLVDENGNDLENGTLTFMDVDGNTDILWEPGSTFLTQGFKVVNNGNLQFKYKILVTGLDGDSELLDVIKFSVVTADQTEAALAGKSYTDLVGEWQFTFDSETGKNVATQIAPPASELMYVVAHFDEAAGNKYQGLSLEGIGITVYATQDTVENDSFDNQYDNRAFVEVANQKELTAAITNATEPTVIFLADGTYTLPTIKDKDIEFVGSKNVVFDMANAVNASNSALKFEGVSLVFDNDNYEGFQHAANVAFENCALTGTQFLYAPVVEFIDCTFNMYNEKTEYSVWTYGAENVTFTGCTFNTHGKAILVYNEQTTSSFVANVTLNNCLLTSDGIFNDKAAIETGSNANNTETSNKYNIVVNNTTVVGFAETPKGTATGTTVYGNKNSMDAAHLNVVMNNVEESNKIAFVDSIDEFESVASAGGTAVLEKDIVVNGDRIAISTTEKTIINLNGKTIKVEGNGSAATDRLFYTQTGSDLVITGNGTINFGDSSSSIAVGGYGSITIENGTFIRDRYTDADKFYPLIENTKNATAGTKFVINGGYFDSGYYNLKTDGTPDCFNNCRQLINSTWSACDIVVYGGTFVGANPAWGDEGMTALCTVCGGNTYCQQVFLDGQNRTDTELPAGYTITESALDDGRPVFTVSYSK